VTVIGIDSEEREHNAEFVVWRANGGNIPRVCVYGPLGL
jgi:hypothetical protein